jgi:hypothetical protein
MRLSGSYTKQTSFLQAAWFLYLAMSTVSSSPISLVPRPCRVVKPVTAAEALEGIDVQAIVHDLLKNGSRPVKLQTLTVYGIASSESQSRM